MTVNDLKKVINKLIKDGLGDVNVVTGFYDEDTDEIITDDIAILAVDGEKDDEIVLIVDSEAYDAITDGLNTDTGELN